MSKKRKQYTKEFKLEALEKWEPRIVVDAVRVEPDPVRAILEIIVEYHPTDSHESRSLVYPFYLLPDN